MQSHTNWLVECTNYEGDFRESAVNFFIEGWNCIVPKEGATVATSNLLFFEGRTFSPFISCALLGLELRL